MSPGHIWSSQLYARCLAGAALKMRNYDTENTEDTK